MRYIQKLEIPTFFTKTIKDFKIWKDFKDKKQTKKYILENEQNWLCGYCEAKINLDNSHIEHIKPKYLDIKNLTFNYNNLLVSCNGNCFSEKDSKLSCGHKKENEFNENKFLDPTRIKNIRDYFIYENYKIKESNLNKIKSEYMIDILKLNDSRLSEARKKVLIEFRNSILKKSKLINK